MPPAVSSGPDPHRIRGAIDRGALLDFRDVFETMEPLADGSLDDFINPTALHIDLSDGIGPATSARIDVRWTVQNDYNIHYTDSDSTDLRWDIHPHDYPNPPDDRHFHPPPNATTSRTAVEESCIRRREIVLVARAVHQLWRKAFDQGSLSGINNASNPP